MIYQYSLGKIEITRLMLALASIISVGVGTKDPETGPSAPPKGGGGRKTNIDFLSLYVNDNGVSLHNQFPEVSGRGIFFIPKFKFHTLKS